MDSLLLLFLICEDYINQIFIYINGVPNLHKITFKEILATEKNLLSMISVTYSYLPEIKQLSLQILIYFYKH